VVNAVDVLYPYNYWPWQWVQISGMIRQICVTLYGIHAVRLISWTRKEG